jgi:hypothetical protein
MKLTKKNRQTGGAVTLSPDEANIFNRIIQIYSIPEGEDREEHTDEIDKDIKEKLLSNPTIDENMPLQKYDHYSSNEYYSTSFKKVINTFEEIVLKNGDNSNVIYISIGKAFSKFFCNKNDFNNRFAKYILDINKVRVYNKLILIQKLNSTINKIIDNIGNCDTNFISRLTPGCVKNFFASFNKDKKLTVTENNVEACDLEKTGNSEKIIASEMLSTNVIRTQLISLIEMYNSNIVSYREALNKKIQNPPFWLRNPAFLTATTVFVNATLAVNSVGADLVKNTKFIENSNLFITHVLKEPPMAAALIASTFISFAVPLGGLAFWGLATLVKRGITDTEWYQLLKKSSEINLAFINSIKQWINKDKQPTGMFAKLFQTVNKNTIDLTVKETRPTMKECSLTGDSDEYWENFEESRKLIEKYLEASKDTFDNENLCLYSINAYSIICGSPPIEQLDEPEQLNISEQSSEESIKTPVIQTSNKITYEEANKLIVFLIQTPCISDYKSDETLNKFISEEKEVQFKMLEHLDKQIYNEIIGFGCRRKSTKDVEQLLKPFIDYLKTEFAGENYKYMGFLENMRKCLEKGALDGEEHKRSKKSVQDFLILTTDEQVTTIKNNIRAGRTTNVLHPIYKFNCENLWRTYTDYIGGGKKSRKMRKRKGKTQNKRSKKRKTIRRR